MTLSAQNDEPKQGDFLTALAAINALQSQLIDQLHHITHSLDETELPCIHQNLLLRGELLHELEQQHPETLTAASTLEANTLLSTLKHLDTTLAEALNAYHDGLAVRLNSASKQRCGLSQYAQAGYLPEEILYRDEA